MDKLKKCTICGVEQPLDCFHNKTNSTDGKQKQCKKCIHNYYDRRKEELKRRSKKYYETNKSAIQEQSAAYRKSHKDEIKKRNSTYYYTNKERILECDKQYRESNKEKIREHKKEYAKINEKHIKEYARQWREAHKKEKPPIMPHFSETGELLKRCGTCKQYKSFSMFSKSKHSKDGYKNRCKECVHNYNEKTFESRQRWYKGYHEKNREILINRGRAYYARPDIKERHSAWAKRYAILNKERIQQRSTEYRKANKEKIKERSRLYYLSNPEKRKESQKKYHETHRQEILEKGKVYRQTHKKEIAAYQRSRINNDPAYKLKCRVSKMVWYGLTTKGGDKAGESFFSHVGYTLQELKKHIENQFVRGMSWDNWGTLWQLHHITPQSSYVFTSMDDPDFKECWELENLIPLENKENHRLGTVYRNYTQGKKEPEMKDFYKVDGSLLPWALEEMTRKAAVKIIRKKKEEKWV
jgi:hypothetical protein